MRWIERFRDRKRGAVVLPEHQRSPVENVAREVDSLAASVIEKSTAAKDRGDSLTASIRRIAELMERDGDGLPISRR